MALVMTGTPLHKNRFIENLVKQHSKSIKVLIEINFKLCKVHYWQDKITK